MKLMRSLIATGLFCLVLGLTYLLHIKYLSVNVVFYAAIIDGVIAVAVTATALLLFSYFQVLNLFERGQLLIIWLLLGYCFAISIPTVIDRSLSFYILEKLQQRGGGIRLDSFEKVFTNEYVREHRLMDVRLTEQQESGTLQVIDGCVKLTRKGESIATFSRLFRQHLLPKKRLLMGRYTDELTDPFRNSIEAPGYSCD